MALLAAVTLLAACVPAVGDSQAPPRSAPPAGDALTVPAPADVGLLAAPPVQAILDDTGGLASDPAWPGEPGATEPTSADSCNLPPPAPPAPGASQAERWRAWREPLPAAALWNPPGPKRVGLQAGHWLGE